MGYLRPLAGGRELSAGRLPPDGRPVRLPAVAERSLEAASLATFTLGRNFLTASFAAEERPTFVASLAAGRLLLAGFAAAGRELPLL